MVMSRGAVCWASIAAVATPSVANAGTRRRGTRDESPEEPKSCEFSSGTWP